jgi:hypothetical protein
MSIRILRRRKLAESSLGIPANPRPVSKAGMSLSRDLDNTDEERMLQVSTAEQIAKLFGLSGHIGPGVTGLRIWCSHRDALKDSLARLNIFTPVHWRDGDWSGAEGRAADFARNTLTVPCPGLTDRSMMDEYLDRLDTVVSRYQCRVVSVNGSE